MTRWYFKEEAPWSVKVVLVLFMAVLLPDIAAAWSIPEWAPRVPDALHSVPMRYQGGTTYFVEPWMARAAHYADWLALGFGTACVVLFILYRDKLERVR